MTFEPEKYQKVISDVLVGCSGVANIGNDLINYGTDLAKHDSNLRQVLTRVRREEKELTVNGDKCQFRLLRLTLFGHEPSSRGIAPSEGKNHGCCECETTAKCASSEVFCATCPILGKVNSRQVAEPLRRLLRNGGPE